MFNNLLRWCIIAFYIRRRRLGLSFNSSRIDLTIHTIVANNIILRPSLALGLCLALESSSGITLLALFMHNSTARLCCHRYCILPRRQLCSISRLRLRLQARHAIVICTPLCELCSTTCRLVPLQLLSSC